MGKYASSPGTANCLPCPAGSYSGALGAITCTPCSPGLCSHFTSRHTHTFTRRHLRGGQRQRGVCAVPAVVLPAGHRSIAVLRLPARPRVAFNGTRFAPQSVCCLAHLLCAVVQCDSCEIGYFSSKPGSAYCSPCPAGSRSFLGVVPGSSNCSLCDVGSYTDIMGSALCRKCPPGSHAASRGLSTCSLCEQGRYSSQVCCICCSFCGLFICAVADGFIFVHRLSAWSSH